MSPKAKKAPKVAPGPPQSQQVAIRRPPSIAEAIERVVIAGDLSPLSPEQRLEYYRATCKSLGLNPLTKPFDYLQLNGKLTLYARRDCTDQLRKIHQISVIESKRSLEDGLCVVEVKVMAKDGRTDTGTGAVLIDGHKGEGRANVIMKAETKAKRRATLSICGLGMLDESELDTMSGSFQTLTPGGRVIEEHDSLDWCSKHNCDIEKCPADGHTQAENEEMDQRVSDRKKTPEQREVMARKASDSSVSKEAKKQEVSQVSPAAGPGKDGAAAPDERPVPPAPEILYSWENEHAHIEPIPGLTTDVKRLLLGPNKRNWNADMRTCVFDGEEFESLKFELSKRGIVLKRKP